MSIHLFDDDLLYLQCNWTRLCSFAIWPQRVSSEYHWKTFLRFDDFYSYHTWLRHEMYSKMKSHWRSRMHAVWCQHEIWARTRISTLRSRLQMYVASCRRCSSACTRATPLRLPLQESPTLCLAQDVLARSSDTACTKYSQWMTSGLLSKFSTSSPQSAANHFDRVQHIIPEKKKHKKKVKCTVQHPCPPVGFWKHCESTHTHTQLSDS